MNPHPDDLWTVDGAVRNKMPPHTWIEPWTGIVLATLRQEVLKADWRWHLVGDVAEDLLPGHDGVIDELPEPRMPIHNGDSTLVREIALTARQRYARPRSGDGPRWPATDRTLLAVGPGFDGHDPELLRLARLGRSVGIHLAVTTYLRTPQRAPREFGDNITGFWEQPVDDRDPRSSGIYLQS